MRWTLGPLLALWLTGVALPAAADRPNLLQNNGFEALAQGWSLPKTASVVTPGRSDGHCLRISNPTRQFAYASQRVAVDGSQFRRITLEAWMRWDGVVQGPNSWDGARMHLTFHDAAGNQLGGYPDAGIFFGTSDWQLISRGFDVPPQTASVVLWMGFSDCVGTVWFDDVRLQLRQGRQLAIFDVSLDRTQVPRYGRAEMTIDLDADYTNPFDPAEIELNGVVTTPTGKEIVVPGFYTQEYSRRLVSNTEQLTAQGEPGWRLRVCATEPGVYRVTATARDRSGKQVTAPPVQFTALASTDPGFVRRGPRYFAFDSGAAYIPFGANVCWADPPGTFSYDRWFARYGAAKCTYSRLWLGPTWSTFGLDRQGVGKIDLASAWRLDYVLALAEKYGLYLMLCLDSYNELRFASDGAAPFWEQTPHNAANGGPLKQPREFWTHPEMDRLYRNRLRYLVARLGANTHVVAWEFWNEVDIVSPTAWNEGEVRDWHARMAQYLRDLDPHDHLITTSFANPTGVPAIDRLLELDYVQTHTYGARDMTGEILARQKAKSAYGKPHYVGECGLDVTGESIDKAGINLHNALWSGLFSGGAGTGMLWWWDNHIDPDDLYYHFAAVTGFMQGIDPIQLALQPVPQPRLTYVVPPVSPTLADLELPANEASFDPSPANRPTTVWITGNGDVRIDAALSKLLHGVTNHPTLHNPVTFYVNVPRPTQLVIQVSGVSGYGGARLVARLNGALVLDNPMPDPDGNTKTDTLHQYDGAYTIPIPAGPQTVLIENLGIDWMVVGYVLKDGRALVDPPLRALALSGPTAALAWVQNPENEWNRVLVQKLAPRTVAPTVLELTGLAEGRYQVTLWDTYRSVVIQRSEISAQNGALSVPLPEIRQDLAVLALRQ